MGYLAAFTSSTALIKSLGIGNAHLIWAMGLYMEEPDLEALASEGLTDGSNDKKIDFITTFTTKMMTYALGRGVESYDEPVVRSIIRDAARDDYRMSSLILGIVHSAPFQMRRTAQD